MTPATLLLVDDSEAIAELIVEVLTDAGYAVEWVADGNRAMELVERRPRLVLTDMMHPGPDGGSNRAAVRGARRAGDPDERLPPGPRA